MNVRSRSRSRGPTGRPRSRSGSSVRRGSSSNLRTHDESGNMIDDEPIESFISALDSLAKDEWRGRTLAFETLISHLPENGEPSKHSQASGILPWYKSYTALRRLSHPISSLLLNPRSTVVKHTTQHLAFLVQRVKDANAPGSDMCKYLLKDLLTPVMSMHAQTVNVIRTYAMEMMTTIIRLCRFKSGLPVLLERLRKDKAREVREACVIYLNLIVKHWSDNGSEGHPYLTSNICTHIGNGLARAMTDPAQSVRTEAKKAFEIFRRNYPELWSEIVHKPDGILSKDARLKKSIVNLAMKADKEGVTHIGEDDGDDRSWGSKGSKSSINSWTSNSSFVSRTSKSSRPGYRATNGRSNGSVRSNSRMKSRSGGDNILPPGSSRSKPFGSITSPDRGASRKSMPTKPKMSVQRGRSVGSASTLSSGNVLGDKKPNENYVVANQLLAAHKTYIDDLMEGLRGEMNTVRDFETLLVKSLNAPNDDGTYGPSEDDVLKYYEAVYAYLDKGNENAMKLRSEMEKISKSG